MTRTIAFDTMNDDDYKAFVVSHLESIGCDVPRSFVEHPETVDRYIFHKIYDGDREDHMTYGSDARYPHMSNYTLIDVEDFIEDNLGQVVAIPTDEPSLTGDQIDSMSYVYSTFTTPAPVAPTLSTTTEQVESIQRILREIHERHEEDDSEPDW